MANVVYPNNIDKVESLDFETIKEQLQYIFKDDKDIVNFVNFLKNIKNFVNLSNDKRHMTLIDLGYFKSQIQLFEKRIQSVIDKKKQEQTRNAINQARGFGEKLTDNVVISYIQDDDTLDGLEELHHIVQAWYIYMQDLYFLCGQTNKNLGNFGGY